MVDKQTKALVGEWGDIIPNKHKDDKFDDDDEEEDEEDEEGDEIFSSDLLLIIEYNLQGLIARNITQNDVAQRMSIFYTYSLLKVF
jgi:hypothetical protein